jgi:hypothetical protein
MSLINTIYKKLLETSQSSKKQKEFGYLVLIVLALIFGYDCYKNGFSFNPKINGLIITFVVVLIITFVVRTLFFPILFIWLFIGEVLGAITSTIIMGIVYFLLFSPIVLLLKIFRKEKPYKPEWKTVTRAVDYTKLS